MANLEEIDFSNNNINGLYQNDFKGATKLLKINFQHNNISILDEGLFVYTPDLTTLDLSYNNIKGLRQNHLKGAAKLSLINFSHNNITIIETGFFTHTCNLTVINFAFNELSTLNKNIFAELQELTHLDLSHNKLSTLNKNIFAELNKLTRLDLSHNKLSTLDKNIFAELQELTHLDLSYNSIQTIDGDLFRNNTILQQLNLENNPIQRFDQNILILLTKPVSVDISCDHVKEFDSSYFTENIQFQNGYVTLSENRLDYSRYCFEPLKYFNISGNKLENTQETIQFLGPPIETLDVSSNFMGNLSAKVFEKFMNLKYLNLQNTRLTTIDSNTFFPLLFATSGRKLEVLILNDNPIQRLNLNIISPVVNSVDVQVDFVEEIDTSCIGNSVKIDSNDKDEIVFTVANGTFKLCSKVRFKQISYFNISGNQLQNTQKLIDMLGAPIETLDLSLNFIGPIKAQTFERFNNLKYLNLSQTNLSNFGFSTFYHQRNLETLDLSFNRLKKVDFTLLYRNFQHLHTLRLEGNELNELNSVNPEIFQTVNELGISKNHLSCEYLAKFLPQWHLHNAFVRVQFITYPTNKTNIDGIDCFHENDESTTLSAKTVTTSRLTTTPTSASTLKTTTTEKSTRASQDMINVKPNFKDNSTVTQRTIDNNKSTTSDVTDQTAKTEEKPATRFECTFLSSPIDSEIVQLSCDHIKEIDTSCMGKNIQIDSGNDGEIVFHSSQTNFELRCSKENFQKLKYLNISGNQLQNTSQLIALLGPSVETLDVSSNFIGEPSTQTFKRFTNLKYLNLSNTNLSTFAYGTFFNQQKLEVLDLAFNRLGQINFIKFLRNFRKLNTLNIEGNDLTEINSITKSTFPVLSSLAISKNRFSCNYLATFLLKWDNLQLIKNPSDETHIDGVDCHEEVQSITKTVGVKSGHEVQTTTTTEFDSSTQNSVIEKKNFKGSNDIYKPVDTESSSLSADVRVLKYLFVAMLVMLFVMCSGYLVVKMKLIQRIKYNLARDSFETTMNQQYSPDSTHTSVIELSQRDRVRVKKLKACSGYPLDETLPGRFPNVQIYDISFTEIEILTSANLNFESPQKLKERPSCQISIFNIIIFPFWRLSKMNFSYNKLSRLDKDIFAELGELTHLDLSHNSIQTMHDDAFENNTKLKVLNISGNHLQNTQKLIDMLGIPIETLDLSLNFIGPIKTQTFERFYNLKYLNLSQTNLSNFVFSTFYHQRSLETLDLSFNRLKKVNFTLLYRNFQHLHTLGLGGNELNELNSANPTIFPVLNKLGISKNHFSCDYLASFLHRWHIYDVQFITYPTNQTNIVGIDCFHAGDELSTLPATTETPFGSTITPKSSSILSTTEKETTASQDMPNVKPSFKENSIVTQHIIESNKSTTSDVIDQTTEPKEKPPMRFDCTFLSSTMYSETVQLSCDHIEEIDTSCMGNNVQINSSNDDEVVFHLLQNNSELRCSKENFQKLKYLNISGNQLQNTSQLIALLGPSVESLDVSSNFIEEPSAQTFKELTNLKYLNLSRTNLSTFAYGTFFNQRKLQVLDISFNRLERVDFTNFLRNFRTLSTLSLEGNDLSEINSITKTTFPALATLAISKNRFSCNYLATFLLKWDNLQLLENPSDKTHIDGVDCHEEVQMKSKLIQRIRYNPARDSFETAINQHYSPDSTHTSVIELAQRKNVNEQI
ncbi:uncharacterized protein LOC129570360 [Sitodiplosis mosellana]|uniref:uncharacterized protein LOC129570360 n=1 Tax=Sitodiplosis mosellana TaxID=263140 RepID=UPI0024450748|nr:uncharacterized protein LOC129570360 [Sitodiplosis mosellana]